MRLRINMRPTYEALRYGSALVVRMLLALATSLFALFTVLGSVTPEHAPYVLVSGFRYGWVAAFALDAMALWWRLADPHPRPVIAGTINVVTFALWVGITGGTILAARRIDPDIVGYIIICLMSLHVVVRTELTTRDRETA